MGFIMDFLSPYEYYNAPEGQDPVGKIVGFGKWGFTAGTLLGLYDCCLLSKTQNVRQVLNTAGFWIVPLTGMCVSFAGVTYIVAKTRGVDDHFNYFLGTLSSAYILHVWCKNPVISMSFALYGFMVAAIKKDCDKYGKQKILELKEGTKQWTTPWKNLESRNYLFAPRFVHNKEEYYRHI